MHMSIVLCAHVPCWCLVISWHNETSSCVCTLITQLPSVWSYVRRNRINHDQWIGNSELFRENRRICETFHPSFLHPLSQWQPIITRTMLDCCCLSACSWIPSSSIYIFICLKRPFHCKNMIPTVAGAPGNATRWVYHISVFRKHCVYEIRNLNMCHAI